MKLSFLPVRQVVCSWICPGQKISYLHDIFNWLIVIWSKTWFFGSNQLFNSFFFPPQIWQLQFSFLSRTKSDSSLILFLPHFICRFSTGFLIFQSNFDHFSWFPLIHHDIIIITCELLQKLLNWFSDSLFAVKQLTVKYRPDYITALPRIF